MERMKKMQKLIEVIKFIVDKYLSTVNVIISENMLTLEYLYYINGEQDVYKTMQVTESNKELNIKFIPEKVTRKIEVSDLNDIFEILNKQVHTQKFTREEIQKIKNKYKEGMIIELEKMYDLFAPPNGTKGTVRGVDDEGHILVNWNTGSSLNLIEGTDKFRIIK